MHYIDPFISQQPEDVCIFNNLMPNLTYYKLGKSPFLKYLILHKESPECSVWMYFRIFYTCILNPGYWNSVPKTLIAFDWLNTGFRGSVVLSLTRDSV